jgi:AraC family transcriptional regulator, glycine betaine-responsive activator
MNHPIQDQRTGRNHARGHNRSRKGLTGPSRHLAQSPGRLVTVVELGVSGPSRDLAQRWQELAHEASYSVSVLARRCGVSVRTLERLFPRVVGQPPERWLNSLRMQRALEFWASGSTVPEAAARLAYQDKSRFLEDFQEQHGFCPSSAETHTQHL